MRINVPNDDGYLFLNQLWEGDLTICGCESDAASALARTIAEQCGGNWDSRYANWIISYRRALSLTEALLKIGSDRAS